MDTQAYLIWFAAGIFLGMLAGIRWSFDHADHNDKTDAVETRSSDNS